MINDFFTGLLRHYGFDDETFGLTGNSQVGDPFNKEPLRLG